jgi:hypothetical protein
MAEAARRVATLAMSERTMKRAISFLEGIMAVPVHFDSAADTIVPRRVIAIRRDRHEQIWTCALRGQLVFNKEFAGHMHNTGTAQSETCNLNAMTGMAMPIQSSAHSTIGSPAPSSTTPRARKPRSHLLTTGSKAMKLSTGGVASISNVAIRSAEPFAAAGVLGAAAPATATRTRSARTEVRNRFTVVDDAAFGRSWRDR